MLEQKAVIETLLITENETNKTIDDLKARMSYISDLNIGYALLSMDEDKLRGANLTMAKIATFLNKTHSSILYRNIIAKVSVRDIIILPQYNVLMKINIEVIAEIENLTKEVF